MFLRIQEAKEVLLCQKRRADYDRDLANDMVAECEAVDLQRTSRKKPVVSESATMALW
jgi:hypothetical protein